MSAQRLMNEGKVGCPNCGADWTNLNPKGSAEAGVYHCRCEQCGDEDTYVFPKSCLECFAEDWAHYEEGDYPEDCPNCGAVEWGME